ncbi:hypothetical protein AMECASPLE_019090 [Ameca splendens]|uniref:Uncharacterized protein n=1 Tax=Ameca splendens TaxID=208324 RepID=A0ABV0YEW5_9TELE
MSPITLLQDTSTVCLYVKTFRYLHLDVVNVQRIESQCIKLPKRIVQTSNFTHEMISPPPPISSCRFPFHPSAHFKLSLCFLYTRVKLPKKRKEKECMQNILKLSYNFQPSSHDNLQ